MDIFDDRAAGPMLISEDKKPFDSPDFLYELKFDGMRCLAYLDKTGCDLRNKKSVTLSPMFPELESIYKQVAGRIILDGELIVMASGKPDFEKLQRRALMSAAFKVKLAADANPDSFVAFDILYKDGKELFSVPLRERKELLSGAVKESVRLSLPRVTVWNGIALYNLAEKMDLEGIVAKRTGNLYYPGKRTKDWIKIKYMQEEDFIAAGYIQKEGNVISLVLGREVGNGLVYEGHVTLGVSRDQVGRMDTTLRSPFGYVPPGSEGAVWFEYMPLCTVKYMKRTSKGGMRQPVFKGFRIGALT